MLRIEAVASEAVLRQDGTHVTAELDPRRRRSVRGARRRLCEYQQQGKLDDNPDHASFSVLMVRTPASGVARLLYHVDSPWSLFGRLLAGSATRVSGGKRLFSFRSPQRKPTL